MVEWRKGGAAVGWLLWALIGVGCGDDESALAAADAETASGTSFPHLTETYEPNCAGYTQKLRDCGILGEGPFTCTDPVTTQDECAYQCAALASCGILSQLVCNGVRTFPLESCFLDCDNFQCGDGESIRSLWACDGYADCADASDEASCETCGTGEIYAPRLKCDQYPHCPDGSDEHGCDSFHCGSGEMIPPNMECNMTADCEDGSDEADCEVFACETTDETIYTFWQCDGEEDCLDGSDERGCAVLSCP